MFDAGDFPNLINDMLYNGATECFQYIHSLQAQGKKGGKYPYSLGKAEFS